MPNRTLKESIRESESIDMLSHASECTFYRLLTLADDYGLFKAKARLVNRALYPLRDYSDDEVSKWLNEISKAGMVVFYVGEDGKPYGKIVSWDKYNTPRNSKAKFPEPTEDTELFTDYYTFKNNCMQLHADVGGCKQSLSSAGNGEQPQADGSKCPRSSSSTRSSSSNRSSSFSPNSPEIQLSQLLYQLIRKRDPKAKKPDLQKWATHIDRLIRLDGRSQEDVAAVIRWCQADDFWQNNVLGTEKLRKQFDQLYLKMKSNGKPKPKGDWMQQQNIAAAREFLEGGSYGE